MKNYWSLIVGVFACLAMQTVVAQSNPTPFFAKNGTVALQTTELDALADTMAVVNHRADDIQWSRTVYRVIDMRDKQNYQLYFPVLPTGEYKSLFRVILDAVVKDTLKAYGKVERDIVPLVSSVLDKDSLTKTFVYITNDTVNKQVVSKEELITNDPVSNTPQVNDFLYPAYVKDQLKFLIQEIIFFDKHTSRLYSKIMAIAPMYSQTETAVSLQNLASINSTKTDAWQAMQSSVLCWFLFDELRPYLAKQYVIPNGNDSQRLTYDEFFTQHLYSSYIAGDSNSRGWMILRYQSEPEKIRKEQVRIETELMNFEQDLWEY